MTLKERCSEHAGKIIRMVYGNHQEIVIDRVQFRALIEETFYSALLLAATSQTQDWASNLGRQTAETQELINTIFIKPE